MEKKKTIDKSMISSKIVCDSINWLGNRLTTMVLTYPRYIHSEFMTHRVISKNSASSRAIPVKRVIEDVVENTVFPIWTKNQKGMSGEIITDEGYIEKLNRDWIFVRDFAINEAGALNEAGVHKQNANRILEPFQHIRVIATATDWDNFFTLRDHPAAMPEIQELARAIRKAMQESFPRRLDMGEWHIPFGDRIDEDVLLNRSYELLCGSRNWEIEMKRTMIADDVIMTRAKIAAARCARISYNTYDGEFDIEKDIELCDRLIKSKPQHLSPTEHIARVPYDTELDQFHSGYLYKGVGIHSYTRGKYVSNLTGWIQFRKLIEDGTNSNGGI